MANIVEPPKPKRATCDACGCVVEYLPEEVKSASYTCMGDSSGHNYVPCPRDAVGGGKCKGQCIIKGTQY